MADLRAIDSFVQSLARWLRNSYDKARKPTVQGGDGHDFLPAFAFEPVSSTDLSREDFWNDTSPGAEQVAIFLYRASIDPHLRMAGRPQTPEMQPVPLSLDLHLLFSFWSEKAQHDHLVLAWLMRQFHLQPVLDASALNPDAGWGADEVVHLIPSELSNEDMMRLWDALTPSYRLSVSYIARVIRIDPDRVDDAGPVVARRLRFGILEATP
jgi:Pvc16 N-terminal domain